MARPIRLLWFIGALTLATHWGPGSHGAHAGSTLTGADLSVAKAGDVLGDFRTVSALGEPVQFSIFVTNLGPGIASEVVVKDGVPPGVTLLPLPTNCMLELSNVIACSFATIPPGGLREIQIGMVGSLVAPLTNTVGVLGATPDPNLANNSDQIFIGQQPLGSEGVGADLEVRKSVSPRSRSIAKKTRLTYHVTVTNLGPATAENVQLVDTAFAPAGSRQEIISHTTSVLATCRFSSPRDPFEELTPPIAKRDRVNLVCAFGDLAPGASVDLDLVVRTRGPARTGYGNGVGVFSETPDPLLANNEDLVVVPDARIVGDVDGDGLVTRDDKQLAKACKGENIADNPTCADADADGDGDVDKKDKKKVAKALNTKVLGTAVAQEGRVTTMSDFTLLALEYGLSVFIGSKKDFIASVGKLKGAQKTGAKTPKSGVSTSKFKRFTSVPNGELVGATGCNPCVGVILFPPNPATAPIDVFHFATGDSPSSTMEDQGPYPAGTRAAIFGGNAVDSTVLYDSVESFLDANPQIVVDGYMNRQGLWVDNQGTYFITPSDKKIK